MHGSMTALSVVATTPAEDVEADRAEYAREVLRSIAAEVEAREAERQPSLVEAGVQVSFARAVFDKPADWIAGEVLWTGSHTLVVLHRPWGDAPAPEHGPTDIIRWDQLREVRGWPETHESYREAIARLSNAEIEVMRLRVAGGRP